jgi:serine phosphatase RsbU (regulator of sigma subunit)
MIEEKLKQKLKTVEIFKKANVHLLGVIAAALLSFIFTNASIGGVPVPVSAAFAAALSPLMSAAALTGALLGYISAGTVGSHITDIVAMAVISAFEMLTARHSPFKGRPAKIAFSGLIYIVSGFVISAALSAETPFSVTLAMAVLFRGVLCAAGTAVFISAKNGHAKGFGSVFDKAALAFVFVLLINALSALSPFDLNIGRFAGILSVIIIAFTLGNAYAMPVFALSMLGQALYSTSNINLYFIIAAAALVFSLFRYSGKLPAAVAFTIVSLAASIVTGFPANCLYLFVEIFIALIIFMLLPERFYAKHIKKLDRGQAYGANSSRIKRFSDIFKRVVEKSERAAAVLNNLPVYGKNKGGDVIGIESLRLTADIFESGLRQEISETDNEAIRLIGGLLSSLSAANSVNAGTDKSGFFHAEIFISSELSEDMKERIKTALEACTGKIMEDKPFFERAKKNFLYIFSEAANLQIDFGLYESPAEESVSGGYSGDSFESFKDGFGSDCFIISDGMGSGARAAVESAMAVSMVSDLIKGGVEPIKALRFANFTLEEKSNDETTTTLDLLIINRYTGLCSLTKLGAAKTVAKIGDDIVEYQGTSLPAGIILDNEPDMFTFNVKSGDRVAIFSDGVMAYSKMEEILKEDNVPPELAAKIIAETDPDFEDDYSRSDDKTLAFITIT